MFIVFIYNKILVLMFLLFPFFASAAIYTLPSGLQVNVVSHKFAYIKEFKEFTLPSGLKYVAEVLTLAPISAKASELSLTDNIKLYIIAIANKYKVNSEELLALADCESNFNPQAYNPKDPHGGAYGIFQYLRPTFNIFAKEGKFKNFEYKNWKNQSELTAWAFSKGYQKHWFNCYVYITTGRWPK